MAEAAQVESSIDDLKSIEQILQERALKLEQQRLEAHRTAMAEIAKTKAEEDKRKAAAQEILDEKQRLLEKRKRQKEEAEAEARQQEQELRILQEQEQNRAQSEVDATIARREFLARQIAEIEHQEELAKKELHDLLMRGTGNNDSEHVMDNPLQRFLQPKE